MSIRTTARFDLEKNSCYRDVTFPLVESTIIVWGIFKFYHMEFIIRHSALQWQQSRLSTPPRFLLYSSIPPQLFCEATLLFLLPSFLSIDRCLYPLSIDPDVTKCSIVFVIFHMAENKINDGNHTVSCFTALVAKSFQTT